MSLDNLNKRGVCCNLYVSYPKYRNRLSLEMFNLHAAAGAGSVLQGPALNLMNDELKAVSAAESRARKALVNVTIPLDMQVGLRFCPVTGLDAMLKAVDAAKAEFAAAADEFVRNFNEHVASARERWQEVVEQQVNLPEGTRGEMLEYGFSQLPVSPPDRSGFVMSLLSVELATPGVPSLADVDAAGAAAAEAAAARVRQETAERMSRLSDSFIASCRRELSGRLVSFFDDMRKVICDGKTINKRTMSRIGEFIGNMNRLNFFRDADIGKCLRRFEAVCFPGGLPADAGETSGVNDEQAVGRISAALDDIMTSIEFSATFGAADAADEADAIAPAPETKTAPAAPAAGILVL